MMMPMMKMSNITAIATVAPALSLLSDALGCGSNGTVVSPAPEALGPAVGMLVDAGSVEETNGVGSTIDRGLLMVVSLIVMDEPSDI